MYNPVPGASGNAGLISFLILNFKFNGHSSRPGYMTIMQCGSHFGDSSQRHSQSQTITSPFPLRAYCSSCLWTRTEVLSVCRSIHKLWWISIELPHPHTARLFLSFSESFQQQRDDVQSNLVQFGGGGTFGILSLSSIIRPVCCETWYTSSMLKNSICLAC